MLDACAESQIPDDSRRTDDFTGRGPKGRDGQRDVDAFAILTKADRLIAIHSVAHSDPRYKILFLRGTVRRNDQLSRPSHRLGLGIAKNPLGRSIPRGNRPRGIFADDGVVRGGHDRGKTQVGLSQWFAHLLTSLAGAFDRS